MWGNENKIVLSSFLFLKLKNLPDAEGRLDEWGGWGWNPSGNLALQEGARPIVFRPTSLQVNNTLNSSLCINSKGPLLQHSKEFISRRNAHDSARSLNAVATAMKSEADLSSLPVCFGLALA